nr:hypothetical protein [Tanacetum cinerariifolium]
DRPDRRVALGHGHRRGAGGDHRLADSQPGARLACASRCQPAARTQCAALPAGVADAGHCGYRVRWCVLCLHLPSGDPDRSDPRVELHDSRGHGRVRPGHDGR